MTDHATLRRMCAAQADVPSALVLELLDAIERVPAPDTAELRAAFGNMRALASREGVYNGNRAVLDLIASAEPLLDALDLAADRLAHMREARDNARAEVERLTAAAAYLRERLTRAASALDDFKNAEEGESRARLHGKAQGVRLALDYLRGTPLDGPQS